MFIIDDPNLIQYLKYAHRYCWDQWEQHLAQSVKDYWENEAHNVEHLILELEPHWVPGT